MTWARLASLSLARPVEAMQVLLQCAEDHLRADGGVVVIAARDPDSRDNPASIEGWVPAGIVRSYDTEPSPREYRNFVKNQLATDEWIVGTMRDVGTHRAFIRRDILGDRPWSSCPSSFLLAVHGVDDRMVGHHALNENLEVTICLDRKGPNSWTEQDRDWLLDLVVGLGPFTARLAMSYGLLRSQQALSPRERETLLHLLDGEPEALIADEMELAHSTVHQYVMSIFRKWDVNSRAELMAKWMELEQQHVDISSDAMKAAYESSLG